MATLLSGKPMTAPVPLFNQTTSANEIQLGAKFYDQAGNEYTWAKAGAVALVAGNLLQAAAEVTNHQNCAPTATASIGATSVTITLGATAATANQYAGGWMVVTETPGEGYKYLISSHPAADSGATLTLTLSDALQVALTTSSHVDLVPNQYDGVIANPTTATSNPVGVATDIIAIGGYGWIGTRGVFPVLADAGAAIVVGTSIVASNQTAGACEPATGVQAPVGTAITGIASGEYGLANIRL